LNGRVDLFNGMQKWNTLKKNEVDYEASLYVSEEMENSISLTLTAAYLSILFNHELLLVAEKQVDVTRKQIERTNKLVEAGSLPRGDLLEIEAQGAVEDGNLISAQNSLTYSYINLKQILDLPLITSFEIDQPNIHLSEELQIIPSEQVYANAVETMPEIKSGELYVESAARSVEIAKGALYPSISLSGGVGTNFNDKQREVFTDLNSPIMSYSDQLSNNRGEYVTLSLSIPIFNGYSTRSYVNRAKVVSISRTYDLQLRKNELRKNIEDKYHSAIAAYQSYNAQKISVESLTESFKYTEEKFTIGMVNSLDYSMAKIKLTQAQSELLRAKYDYIFKTKILDFYMGIPLSL
ncbi:MAG: hypothetical protein GQ527_08455, partial [Bacteroidales bacterium]|nr:hypothetical protein [Bacteroidales bacterium]